MTIDHKNALPQGYKLQEYAIDTILGHGGFGITYKAIDAYLDKPVAIKEYLPQELAIREGQTTVVAKSNTDEEYYQWGLKRFLAEAKTLAKFNHPNIVRVLRFIEAHNTAYLVMDYEEGQSLGDYLETHGPTLQEEEIRNIFLPILDGLRAVHEAGLLHRDIKPDNIFLRNTASPMLIDFGSARYALGEKSRSLSVIVSAGYAPFEQYSSKGKQGPWTDLYGIGASLYRCMTGEAPPEASDRSAALLEEEPDPYIPLNDATKGEYSEQLMSSVDAAMVFRIKDRPQTARAFQQLLMGAAEPVNPPQQAEKQPVPVDSPKKPAPVTPASRKRTVKPKRSESVEIPITNKPAIGKKALWLGLIVALFGVGIAWYLGQGTTRYVNDNVAQKVVVEKEQAKQPQPGDIFRDALTNGGKGPEMVIIPAGSFRMGDVQRDGANDEKPVHTVTIARPFALGRYEVKTAEYLRCVNAGVCQNPEWLEPGSDYNTRTGIDGHYKKFTGDSQPIVGVSWEDAKAYAAWLSNETGKSYRLPSEAEWEYAVRAGSDTKYNWGNAIGNNRANCDGCGSQWDNKVTAPVGSFAANDFGLYDMHGNAWEWVADVWHVNYQGAPDDGSVWATGGDSSRRVLRGGSWDVGPRYLRAANRDGPGPGSRGVHIGFRLAQDL